MKILNLVYPEKSDIKWKPSKFPDGQQQVIINSFEFKHIIHSSIGLSLQEPIQIKSRLNNWLDLELITCAVASLRQLEVKEIHLYVPYILGARSDRKFEEGGNNYLKDVICPAINLLELNSVTCVDPHSNCLEMGINNFKQWSNLEVVTAGITIFNNGKWNIKQINEDFIFISPDAGASHKIYKLAETIGYKGDIITCSKERDENGKLTKTNVPMQVEVYNSKNFIIIDDICDGGATFINIAKEIRKLYPDKENKIYLIVTHGIFSKGFSELEKWFDRVYCTNSYSDLDDYTVNFGDVSSIRQSKFLDTRVKQLDIF